VVAVCHAEVKGYCIDVRGREKDSPTVKPPTALNSAIHALAMPDTHDPEGRGLVFHRANDSVIADAISPKACTLSVKGFAGPNRPA